MRVGCAVYDGQALVKDADKEVKVKGGRELDFAANGPLKAQKFDKKALRIAICIAGAVCDLVMWPEANVDAAGIYASSGWVRGDPAGGRGLYWDPWFDGFTFIPGDGIFYSSFGWGFIRRGTYTARRFMDTATDATVYGGTTIITSARTCTTGGPEPTT